MSNKKLAFLITAVVISACLENWRGVCAEEKHSANLIGEVKGYKLSQSVRVDQAETGVSGYLQIFEDNRITENLEIWGGDIIMHLANTNDPLLIELEKNPLKDAYLRFINKKGRITVVETFERPLARIETAYLYGTKFPTYLIEVDYSASMGSYNGPAVYFLEIRKGIYEYIYSGRKRLSLSACLKNAFRFVPAKNGVGLEIENVECQPNWSYRPRRAGEKGDEHHGNDFVVTYTTYRFDGKHWLGKHRHEFGFWEDSTLGGIGLSPLNEARSNDWPARSKFP